MFKFSYLLKKSGVFLFFAIIILIFPKETESRTIDYFAKPQTGLWFGISTPFYTTYEDVATDLAGGLFFRYTTPMKDLKLGIDSSYHFFGPKGMDGVNTLSLWPIYGNLVYRLPSFKLIPLTYQLKAGAGGTWVKIRPDRVSQWDPMGMVGFEGSFSAGRIFNIGFRIDYLLIYEQHIEGARRNGHIINTGITLFLNILN